MAGDEHVDRRGRLERARAPDEDGRRRHPEPPRQGRRRIRPPPRPHRAPATMSEPAVIAG